jgi:tetratricopeptide (TPR) repeat protein
MKKNELIEAALAEWKIAAGALALIGVAAVLALRGGDDSTEAATSSDLAARVERSALGAPMSGTPVDPARLWTGPSDEAKALADLDRYQHTLNSDPTREEAALAISRIANTYYSRFGDYETAASWYERLLNDYPEYQKNLHGVYANLGACYERMGNLALAKSTYLRMMEHFSEGTHEHAFARQRYSQI